MNGLVALFGFALICYGISNKTNAARSLWIVPAASPRPSLPPTGTDGTRAGPLFPCYL